MWAGAGALLAIGLKGLEILRRADYQFFELKLGNVCAGTSSSVFSPSSNNPLAASMLLAAFE